MELALILWAVGTLPAIASSMCALGFFGTIGSGFSVFVGSIEEYKAAKVMGIIGLVFCIPLWIVGALIPDKETAYAMAAAYGVQTVAENPKVQEVAKDGMDVIGAYLKKIKSDLEKESK